MAEKSINELFDIDFRTDGFIASAKSVVTEQIARNIKQREAYIAKCSKEISERFPTVSPPSTSDLSQIKKKFALYKTTNCPSHECFSDKEIRSMCYFANQIANSTEDYHILIDLIQNRWRQSFLNGLIFCLLNNWPSLEYNIVSSKFQSFIINQLENYQGQRSHLRKMKQNIRFIKEGGSLALGQFVFQNQESVLNAPSIIGLKKRDFSYSYFSKAIQYYFKNKSRTNIAELEEVLTLHANTSTTKIVVSDKIIKANELQNDSFSVNSIKRIALKLVGDPFVQANWNTIGVTQDYVSQIDKAHRILKKWMIKTYVNVAFEKLIVDEDRKQFWLRYVNFIDDIKFVGSMIHKQIIHTIPEPELENSIQNCFYNTIVCRNSLKCAVAIVIKNFVFVEFSEKGNALYIYDNDKMLQRIESHSIFRVDDLKETSMNWLTIPNYYYYYRSQDLPSTGRFAHITGWQKKLDTWFDIKLGINVTISNNQ